MRGYASKLAEAANSVKEIHKHAMTVIGVVTFFAGSIGDFLRPIGPINFLVFGLALVGVGVLLVMRKPLISVRFSKFATVVLAVVALGFGGWWGLALCFGDSTKGVLATQIKPLQNLQASVLRTDSSVTTQTPVAGDKLAEEVKKQLESERDAAKLLAFAFRDYPVNVLRVEPVGELKRRKGTGGNMLLEFNVEVGVDAEQYENYVKKKLLPVLDKIAVRKGEFLFRGSPASERSGDDMLYSLNFSLDRHRLQFSRIVGVDNESWNEMYRESGWRKKLDHEFEMAVVVNTERNAADDRTTWAWYIVPVVDHEVWLSTASRQNTMLAAKARVDLRFLDREGATVTREQLPLQGTSLPGLGIDNIYHKGNDRIDVVFVSPYLLNPQRSLLGKGMTVTHQLAVSADELSRIVSMQGAASPAPP